MHQAKELIERIRRQRFGIGLDQDNLSEDLQAYIEESEQFKNGVSKLIVDLYSEQPQFLFELIQNAEDNQYPEGVKPELIITVQENQLLVQNNELGFSENNVKAICSIGQSTKKDKKLGYIGEKGIGFKSVFLVSDRPYIYSNGYSFQFYNDPENPVRMIVPEWIDGVPACIDLQVTNIVLPFKDDARQNIDQTLSSLSPLTMLFLRKLESVQLEDTVRDQRIELIKRVKGNRVTLTSGDSERKWLLVKKKIDVPQEIHEEKRQNVTETELVLAFELNDRGEAKAEEQNLFAFLPIKKYGFRFIIQGDFLLKPDRQDIHREKQWNLWLRDQIADLFMEAVEEFKKHAGLKRSFYQYIPHRGEVKDSFFTPAIRSIIDQLSQTDCILTENETWDYPDTVYSANSELRKLINKEELSSLLDSNYVFPKIKLPREIAEQLGVKRLGTEQVTACLAHANWVIQKDDKWFSDLYGYLSVQSLTDEQTEELQQLDIIRLQNGDLVSVADQTVFSGLEESDVIYGFESEIPVLSREIINFYSKRKKQEVLDFLSVLGLSEPDPYEIIENYILPIYASDDKDFNWKSKEKTILIGHIAYIKEHMDGYIEGCEEDYDEEDAYKRIAEDIYLRLNKNIEGTNYYSHPSYCVLGKIYCNESPIEELLLSVDNQCFVHKQYIDPYISNPEDPKAVKAILGWQDFFLRLGVNKGFRIKMIDNLKESCLTHLEALELRKGDGSTMRPKISDYDLVSLSKIVGKVKEEQNIGQAKLLLQCLHMQWTEIKDYRYLSYRWYYYNWKGPAKADAAWVRTLRNNPWIPTTKGTLAHPKDVYISTSEIKKELGDEVLYLASDIDNLELFRLLSINTELNARAIVSYLKQLVSDECEDLEQFVRMYTYLDKNCNQEIDYIVDAFSNEDLIYSPGHTYSYCNSDELMWDDYSDLFLDEWGYIAKHYSGLKGFFVNKLNVKQKPDTKDYAARLKKIFDEDEINTAVVQRIYIELNKGLVQNHLVKREKWWIDFLEDWIWITKWGTWCNENDVFVADESNLEEIFKENNKIGILDLPPNFHPQIQTLLENAKIRLLSESVKKELLFVQNPTEDPVLTQTVRKTIPFLLRYIYKRDFKRFQVLNETETLTKLSQLTCYKTEIIEVEYRLNNEKVVAEVLVSGSDSEIYLTNDAEEETVANALAEVIGIKDIVPVISSLILLKSNKKREKWMSSIGYPPIPELEINLLRSKVKDEAEDGVGDSYMDKKENSMAMDPLETINDSNVCDEQEELNYSLQESQNNRRHTNPFNSSDQSLNSLPLKSANGAQGYNANETSSQQRWNDETENNRGEDIDTGDWSPEIDPERVKVTKSTFNSEPRRRALGAVKRTVTGDGQTGTRTGSEQKYNEEELKKIGRWGEVYVLQVLREELSKRRIGGASIKTTEEGFVVTSREKEVARVVWMNYAEDRGQGYDIKVHQGKETWYAEVKSTTTDQDQWFEVSRAQWEFAREQGDNYRIYRVINAGTENAKYREIKNPFGLWSKGELDAHPVRIKV